MQKKIIALAVAGLVSGAAFAQSNVTVYGVVDVYGISAKSSNTTGDQKLSGVNGGGLSGSRIGFKGTESLGNGLTAAFTFEVGTLDPTRGELNNNGIDNTRQAFVGLVGPFGTVVGGRLQTMGYDFGAKYDALGASIFSPIGQLTDNVGLSISGREAIARQNNAVAYISPNFGGFTAMVNYAFGEQVTGTTGGAGVNKAQSVLALGGSYENGPVSAGLVYHDVGNINGTLNNANEVSQKEWALGGSYDLGMAKLIASYQSQKTEVANTSNTKGKAWSLGAQIKAGAAGKVNVAYGRYSNNAVAGNQKANSWGVDYEHSLSKRTTAYVGYNMMNNGANTAFAVGGVTPSNDQNASLLAAGVRHSF